jgi:hypothetical protein
LRFRIFSSGSLRWNRLDPGDAQVKELAVVLDLLAECLDLVELRLELRVVLVLLGPEPEIISLVAVRAIAVFPGLVLVQGLPQHHRVLQVVGPVLPGVDELIALLLHALPLLLHERVVVAFEQRREVPRGPSNLHLCCSFSGHDPLP